MFGEEREESEKRIGGKCLVNVNKEDVFTLIKFVREDRRYLILFLEKNMKSRRRVGNICVLQGCESRRQTILSLSRPTFR